MIELEAGGLGPPFDDECCGGGTTPAAEPLETLYGDLAAIDDVASGEPDSPDPDALEAELSALEAGGLDEDVDLLFADAGDGLALDEELEFVSAGADEEGANVELHEILALAERYPGLRISFSFG